MARSLQRAPFSMGVRPVDEKELARLIAADIGGDVAAETERQMSGEPTPGADPARDLGIGAAVAVASFIASAAQLALQIQQVRQDRALLTQLLLEKAPDHPKLVPERRLGIIGRIVDRLIPESVGASPSVGAQTQRSKQEWLQEWLGIGTRNFTPTVLMPFADMENYIVYQQISWTPPANPKDDLPQVVSVPKGFVTDLATVPPVFWWALPPQGRYGHAAILHDWLYWDQSTSREIADRVFDVAMDELGVSAAIRKAMWTSVRVFGGSFWTNAEEERRAGKSRVLKRFPPTADVRWDEWSKQPDVFA